MKFLIALSVLASTTAFANEEFIKCWETAQEEGGRPAYVFKVKHLDPMLADELNKELVLIKPFYAQLEAKHGCLKSRVLVGGAVPNYVKFCKTDGQVHNGLIPVEVEENEWDGTVYCEKDLKRWFYHDNEGGGIVLTGSSTGL